MLRCVAFAMIAVSLAACGMADTVVEGLKHTKAVEAALEQSTGVKPQVGFNWRNGSLAQVTVTFPRLYETKPLRQLAGIVRRTVVAEFRQKPENIVLAFSLGKGEDGTGAQASR